MKFIFTTCHLIMGGNETLIKRMTEWLLKQGHDVTIITAQGGYLEDKMPSGALVEIVGAKWFGASILPLFPIKEKIRTAFEQASVVMSFSDAAGVYAFHMHKRTNSKAKLLAGVFHPKTAVEHSQYVNDVFWQGIHQQNKIYMNNVIAEKHLRLGYNITGVKIWPLPVIDMQKKEIQKCTKKNENVILSVGRITFFKGYNFYMPKVIRALIDKGYSDVKWYIIGDEEISAGRSLKDEILDISKKLNVTENIIFLGTKSNNELSEYFEKATVFVGMGTSAVEASSHGLPAICALVDDMAGMTYGFLADQSVGCVGEVNLKIKPTETVLEVIESVFEMELKDYINLKNKAYESVSVFDLDTGMHAFLDIVKNADFGYMNKPKGFLQYIFRKVKRYIF